MMEKQQGTDAGGVGPKSHGKVGFEKCWQDIRAAAELKTRQVPPTWDGGREMQGGWGREASSWANEMPLGEERVGGGCRGGAVSACVEGEKNKSAYQRRWAFARCNDVHWDG